MRYLLNRILGYLKTIKYPARYELGHVLLFTLVLLSICLAKPRLMLPTPVYDWLIVVDITQSMNARDYMQRQLGVSRLEYAKYSIRQAVRELPCGSKVSIAMFTERNALNIVRPVEVCEHYASIDQTVDKMDWRMAWAADSFIAHGVYSAIGLVDKFTSKPNVIFLTDGHQAPPANPTYMPKFAGEKGKVNGVLVGIGQLEAAAIPKLDDRNEVAGYWSTEDVQQYGSFGMAETLSVLAMEQKQHDRNAGHGPGAEFLADAHLSALNEKNLQSIADETGLEYMRLQDTQQLIQVMQSFRYSSIRRAETDLRTWLGWPALALTLFYVLNSFIHLNGWKVFRFKKRDLKKLA